MLAPFPSSWASEMALSAVFSSLFPGSVPFMQLISLKQQISWSTLRPFFVKISAFQIYSTGFLDFCRSTETLHAVYQGLTDIQCPASLICAPHVQSLSNHRAIWIQNRLNIFVGSNRPNRKCTTSPSRPIGGSRQTFSIFRRDCPHPSTALSDWNNQDARGRPTSVNRSDRST